VPTPHQKFNFHTLLVLPLLAGLALLPTLPLASREPLIVGASLSAHCLYLHQT